MSFGSGTIANQTWGVDAAESLTLPEATGGTGTITYSLSPTLPDGVTFTAATRVLAGTPTGRFTSATFTYTATDGNSDTVELTFTIVVTADAISFASTVANQAWVIGTAVNLTLPTASGGVGSFTYSLTPALPSGVSFTAATRVVSGNPTATATVATYTYTATDSESVTWTLTFTVVVTASAITFASTIANQAWTVGTAVNLTLPTASGGAGTFTYSLTPTLPSGATFTASTRVLSGTPTGRFTSATFTYTATDTDSNTKTQTFTIVVTAPAIVFSPTSFANQIWVIGTAVDETLPAGSGGVGTLTASLTGTLPTGVTFTASTRALAGTPTADFSVATFTYTMTDAEGVSASITFTILASDTPVALDVSLHNAILFKNPANYNEANDRVTVRGATTIVSEMTDNDYTTYSDEGDVDVNIADASGNPTRVDAVFVKCSGVDTQRGDPTGGSGSSWAARTIPDTVNNFSGAAVETTLDGFQHDLFLLDPPFTATSVRLRFTGSDIKIYAVMLLQIVAQWDVNRIETLTADPEQIDRATNLQAIQGRGQALANVLGGERPKWETDYSVKVVPGRTINQSVDELLHTLGQNENCGFAREFTRFPEQVYPAVVLSDRIQTRLIGQYKISGEAVNFRVGEQ